MRSIFFQIVFFIAFFSAYTGINAYAEPPVPAYTESTNNNALIEQDPLGRTTPQGTLKGFLKAIAADHYDEASQYLDLSALPLARRSKGAEIAYEFKILLDHQGRLQPDNRIKDHPLGNTDDSLEKDIDNIGILKDKNRIIKINLQRITQESGPPIWLFESSLVAEIPKLVVDLDAPLIEKLIIGEFLNKKFHGAPLGQWLTMLGFYIAVYLVSGIIVRGGIRILRRAPWIKHDKTPSEHHLIQAFEIPLRLFVTIWASSVLSFIFGISVIVRHGFDPFSMTLFWIAVGLFLWNLINISTTYLEERMPPHERYNMRSIIVFGQRTAKFLFIILIAMLILDSFGIDITTALAALGIGGIALALGAQKTLENFIGSLSIIIDRPIRIGDYCKIGNTIGVVEDIGMRSTRIRTLDKTLVTIPNGDLSTQRIENYAERPSFLINREIILRYDSSPDQIRTFIAKTINVLKAHEKINESSNMVRFLGFSEKGYTVQIWCYVRTSQLDEFFETQGEITYAIMDAAKESGIYFAIPSQVFLPAVNQMGKPL